MKRKITAFCLFLLLFSGITAGAAPSVSAPNAVLMDARTGLVLYEKNAHETAYPASTTKVMTAILALENGNMDDMVTVSFNAVNSISPDSSKAGLYEGEEISFRDLVHTLLICSANDSANVIAEHIAGDISSFVDMMNTRATELGAKNTHFVNTHGLHNENHYTTAYDLATLARHALTIPGFREIVAMRSYVLQPSNKFDEKRHFNSTNHLLDPNSTYYYSHAIGIKTGYTDHAKSCLVSAAESGDNIYIAAVLGAGNADGLSMSFVDSRALLSYGVDSLPPVTLCAENTEAEAIPVKNAKGVDAVPVHTNSAVSAILPKDKTATDVTMQEYIKMDLEAPVAAGTVIGRREYRLGETKLGETYLVADMNIEKRSFVAEIFKKLLSSIWFYAVLLVLFLIFYIKSSGKSRAKRDRIRRAEIRRRNKYQ